jgi:DNA-nicking Smr family endonuclease
MHSDDDDLKAFRAAVDQVRPLQASRAALRPTPPPPRPRQLIQDEAAALAEAGQGAALDEEVQPGDVLSYAREGVQRAVLRRLRRGGYRIDAELDLHGLGAEQARGALSAFIKEARRREARCLRIIHGKGLRSPGRGPVLKGSVAGWLRRQDAVLAYTSAPPGDGGTGALYVLLRG